MTITAAIVADSVSPDGIRLTTMQLRYPKFIHGEAKTHRLFRIGDKAYELLEEVGFMDYPEFSRNASSSRAIPVERLIEDVLRDPVIPVFWGKNQAGMQAAEELDDTDTYYVGLDGYPITTRQVAKNRWLRARDKAVEEARNLVRLGAHKQIVNRLIEPWCHINVVCTSTEWANFFALRRHSSAQPEMKALADAMWEAREASKPVPLKPGEWHLPYVEFNVEGKLSFKTKDVEEGDIYYGPVETSIKLSVARCARVSYLTHEGKPPNIEDDLRLYDRLVGATPLHASPAEHQATPDERRSHDNQGGVVEWQHPNEHGNLVGWRQYRKLLPNENVADR